MVKLTKIYTRGGDGGETSLGDGSRIAKDDLRVAAYGDIDEANSLIGVARVAVDRTQRGGAEADAMLGRIQNDLFDLGADLCTPAGGSKRAAGALRVVAEQVTRLEVEIDAMNQDLAPLNSFVLPGGCAASAHLHVARTVVRRAERLIVTLDRQQPVGATVIGYVNRLSDHLFVLARCLNDHGRTDVLWQPGANR